MYWEVSRDTKGGKKYPRGTKDEEFEAGMLWVYSSSESQIYGVSLHIYYILCEELNGVISRIQHKRPYLVE